MPKLSVVVDDSAAGGVRLDRYVAETLAVLSRSQVKARSLSARVNGSAVKISRLLVPGDALDIEWADSAPSDLEAQDLPLDVLFENDRVVVVNKDQGLVVHPGAGNPSGTLANALLFRRLARGGESAGTRPGIVHRLDKDTSGVIIAAYDDEALAFLADQFKARSTRKSYIALVKGGPAVDRGSIETRIARDPKDRKRFACVERGGKLSLTLYRVLERYDGYALLLLRPKTGRTHQLRVHLRHLGCPIVGDPIYARPDARFPRATLMLHARRLSIVLPDEDTASTFTAPIPERFRAAIRALRSR